MNIIKKIKHKLFGSNIKKISKVYILPFCLSLWGVGNVFYWEVYKGYKACIFCKWHRGLYISLFILLCFLFKYRKWFFKSSAIIVLFVETIVSGLQVFGANCNPLICRLVTVPEKINFFLASSSFILVILCEIYFCIQKRKNSH